MARAAVPRPPAAALRYEVRAHDRHAHLWQITLTIPKPQARQRVSLPVWIPGSYLVREFARHLQQLQAQQNGAPIQASPLDKCTWELDCRSGKPVTLRYAVYAFDASVRTAWLDTQRGFFNGTSLLLRVHGQEAQPHQLTLSPQGVPARWQAATALPPQRVDARGFGRYLAADYDELVDSPVELGEFWSGSFTVAGVPHRLVVTGAPASFDGARLLADTQAICAAEIYFWGHAPHDRYVFLLNAVHDGYGGLEHRHSTALICQREDLPQLDLPVQCSGYTTLLGLISHEYFHTWNVKRLRPAELARYDYTRENYTELLWFFEGFTNYYDDLLLCRAGLIDHATYLNLLAKAIQSVLQTPGRQLQSVAQASFDAWVKYYRQEENTPNATVSYYAKGSLVALCLDLRLRQSGKCTLDDVMRALWQRCAGGPLTELDVLTVVRDHAGAALARQLREWIHGHEDLPLQKLLQRQGVKIAHDPVSMAVRLGLRVNESQNRIRITHVLRGSAAEAAGLAPQDEWLGVRVSHGRTRQGWRLSKLDTLPLYLGRATRFDALVARDQQLLTLPVKLPPAPTRIALAPADTARLSAWLGPHQKDPA